MAQNDWTPKLDAWLETKIGRLLWLHWYSKLFSMNLTSQTLPISFDFQARTRKPQFSKDWFVEWGTPNSVMFPAEIPSACGYTLSLFSITLNSQYWLPVCHHFPQSSTIFIYLPLFAIFHCLPSSLSFILPIIPVAKNTFSEGFWCFIDCNGHFFTMFTTYLPPNHGRSVRRNMDRMPPTWVMKVVLRPMSLRVTKHCRPGGNPKFLEHGCFL